MDPKFLLAGPVLGGIGGATAKDISPVVGGLAGVMGGGVGAPGGLLAGYLLGFLINTIVRRISHNPEVAELYTKAISGNVPYLGALAGGYYGGRLGANTISSIASAVPEKAKRVQQALIS